MTAASELAGPDLSSGVMAEEVPAKGVLSGRVGNQAVLLSRDGNRFVAVSGSCTHYGASLASGLIDGETVRCPLHHACFSLKTGAVLRGPALDSLDQWQVDVEDDIIFIGTKKKEVQRAPSVRHSEVEQILIVGGGAAGLACASELRTLGYSGAITMASAETDGPIDRPNLSKDFLAGTAPDEWMPLRGADWYRDNGIDLRLATNIVRFCATNRRAQSQTGDDFSFDRLLLATGSEPKRLQSPGFDHPAVSTLRSMSDARSIAERAKPGTRAAIIGSSFIGLEAAAALRRRDVEVSVISPEMVPFERVLGVEVGDFLRSLHESNGVRFHLGSIAASYDGRHIHLADGGAIAADFVLVGIGVRPRTTVAECSGIGTRDGIPVDEFLETAIPGVFAAGDVALYPDLLTGDPVRIEHWVTAQRQGQTAAANMLGLQQHYEAVPFFWTEQFGTSLRYVGHAPAWDRAVIDGDPESGNFLVRYFEQGTHRASAAIGRDLDILKDESRFEDAIADARTKGLRSRELSRALAI